MNLVNEQHVAGPKIGQQRRQIARTRDNRARSCATQLKLGGNDLRQRRLAKAGRAMKKAVIHRIAALTCSGDKGFEIGTATALTNEIGKPFGTERSIRVPVSRR